MTKTKTIAPAAIRFVKTRDSATTILRKLGIKPRDYNFFIELDTAKNFFCVQVAKAEMHLKKLAGNAAEAGMVRAPETEPAPKATKRGGKNDPSTCSAVARTLIREGKTNEEVWNIIKVEFNLDDKKRGYPAWYRFQLRKAGEKV